jgi:hypothetical protein
MGKWEGGKTEVEKLRRWGKSKTGGWGDWERGRDGRWKAECEMRKELKK